MSEHTMKNHQEPIDLCFGMMNCDEKGNIGIPPKYSYKISFQGKDCMVIPLEGVRKKMTICNTKPMKKGGKTDDR